jgi:hypothetical protein
VWRAGWDEEERAKKWAASTDHTELFDFGQKLVLVPDAAGHLERLTEADVRQRLRVRVKTALRAARRRVLEYLDGPASERVLGTLRVTVRRSVSLALPFRVHQGLAAQVAVQLRMVTPVLRVASGGAAPAGAAAGNMPSDLSARHVAPRKEDWFWPNDPLRGPRLDGHQGDSDHGSVSAAARASGKAAPSDEGKVSAPARASALRRAHAAVHARGVG